MIENDILKGIYGSRMRRFHITKLFLNDSVPKDISDRDVYLSVRATIVRSSKFSKSRRTFHSLDNTLRDRGFWKKQLIKLSEVA